MCNFEINHRLLSETAMGVSKSTQDKSGFEYAMAVMKMCDILHLRHTKIWLRPESLFKLTSYAKTQTKLLDIIHGLTKKVSTTFSNFITLIILFERGKRNWRYYELTCLNVTSVLITSVTRTTWSC